MRDCPKCLGKTMVIQTRENIKGETKRRRLCIECKFRYSTIELLIDHHGNIHGKENDRESTALHKTPKRS